MIIMKFGGTSVRNKEAIERVISIVRDRLDRKPLVVVSALAQVTRVLCRIAEEAQSQHDEQVEELLCSLRDRHTSLAAELLEGNEKIMSECISEVNVLCNSLTSFVAGVCRIGELSPRSYARIVSTGELLSSRIVSAAMNVYGISCNWTDARKMLVTDCNYMYASPDPDVSGANIRRLYPEISKGVSVVLTQGFIASSIEGFPSVLGFEGSDYSAAIFGMALDAERVEIWTDVDGIRTADPRIVGNTERIARLSYDEASEMAYLGARVLHPLTIEPARKRNIPVVVLSSAMPDGKGSIVSDDAVESGPKSVSLKEEIDFLQIVSPKIAGVTAMLAEVFPEVASAGVKTGPVSVSESCVSMAVESGQPGIDKMVRFLREKFNVKVSRDKALISVVGKNIVGTKGIIDLMMQCAGNVYMMSESPSLLSVSIVVDKDEARTVVGALHSAIVK